MNPTPTQTIHSIITQIEETIRGKRAQIELALCTFLAGGHLLIDDLPGVGKTTLAKTMAAVLGLHYGRIQFTSDLLPSDILGTTYFDSAQSAFRFKQGPIFCQFLLADEINRASPRTQSALLEAMEEHQVSIDGTAHPLDEHFFVVATKNPFEEVGTFELPLSQLDRFMLSFSLGYPQTQSERAILTRAATDTTPKCALEPDALSNLRRACEAVFISDELLDFIQEILHFSRNSGAFESGLSTRAALSLVAATRAYALIRGRDFATPQDVITLLPFICAHRLRPKNSSLSAHELILAAVHPDP